MTDSERWVADLLGEPTMYERSGEDVRHSYHTAEEVRRLVDSRVVDEEGRIIENDPETDEPPNVIRGNNAEL